MSSEYSMHLWDKKLEARVYDLDDLPRVTVSLVAEEVEFTASTTERFYLYIDKSRLAEVTLLFHKIAQDLADLAVVHATKEHEPKDCPLCGKPGPGVHSECAAHEAAADAQRPGQSIDDVYDRMRDEQMVSQEDN
jgi:hypothetical protein